MRRWAEIREGCAAQSDTPWGRDVGGKEGGERTLERVQKGKRGGPRDSSRQGGEHDYAPSPDEGQTGRDAGFLGEGQEPSSTHSVGGRKGRRRAPAGQSFIMGEGHVTNLNLEEGGRNPEVLPSGTVLIPPLPSHSSGQENLSGRADTLLTVTVGVSGENTVGWGSRRVAC